jgi:N-methylhydantoinase B
MGKVPGQPKGYATAPSAVVGGKDINPGRRHANHRFIGPGYSIAHPGIFPHNTKAKDISIADWLQFDWRAGWGKTVHGISTGHNPAGEPYVLYHWNALSGAGAVAERDGFHQVGLLGALGGLTVPNVEAYERLYPIRIQRHEIRCDSAGPGERRGGAGVEYEAEVHGDVVQSFRSEGLTYAAAYGVNGGGEGAGADMTIASAGQLVNDLPAYGKRSLKDPVFKVRSSGGGGWGDPRRRDPAAVARDVLDGVVSVAAAREIYGVAVDAATGAVDAVATARLRLAEAA